MDKPYRPCVVAVIKNREGWLLAGERADCKNAWQLPQGGVDPGESSEAALFRELREEIGTDQVRILRRLETPITYDFPQNMTKNGLKSFRGQTQDWYLLELIDESQMPDLSAADGEFQSLRWMLPEDLIAGIIAWKKDAYERGLKALLQG